MESSSQVPQQKSNIELGGTGATTTENNKQHTGHTTHIAPKMCFRLRTRFHQQYPQRRCFLQLTRNKKTPSPSIPEFNSGDKGDHRIHNRVLPL